MIVVSQVFNQVGRVLGTCDPDYCYDVLTRAVELLANKPTKTNVLWDPMLIYCDIPVVNNYYVCLPPHIEKPIKININKQPAFTRNQFYEFSLNGPGSNDPESGWSWQDRGWRCLQQPWPADPVNFVIGSTNAADSGAIVLVNVINSDASTQWVSVPVGTPSNILAAGILEVSKPVTQGILQLYTGPNIVPSNLVANWAPNVLYPHFDWIKLSQPGVAVRMLARRRTYVLSAPTDVIPLSNRQAIITSCIAIKAYDTLNWDDGSTAEQNAFRFLDEDQAARNLYQRVSNAAETTPTLNLNINTRDALIVADIYDFACDVFGPIGQGKIFDRITEGIELLANLGPAWDPLIGYVDIQTFDSFYLTLPQYVDQVLAINVNKSTGTFRNQWFEFHMNGLGQDNDNADAVGSNRPCGGWEEIGEFPCAFPLFSPAYLVAQPVSAGDNGIAIRIYGIDVNDLPIYSLADGRPGARISCEQTSYDISDQQLPYKRIDRVVIEGTAQSFINLYATDGVNLLQTLGVFWPGVAEPKFRVIKIGQKAVTVRLRYKKRWLKISGLTDPIHLRSRSAVFNALRSIQTATTDPNSAQVLLMAAKSLLNQEWRATHPHEGLELQFDPSTWGGSMIQMPVLLLPLAAVQGLFPVSRPLAIAGFITAIIVYALKSKPWFRRLTHIAIERLKRFSPLRANCDASRLIVSDFLRSFGAFRPQYHVAPCDVNFGVAHSMGAPKRAVLLRSQASAAFTGSPSQRVSGCIDLLTAIADAKPDCLSIHSASVPSHYDQSVKPLTNEVNRSTHPGSNSVLVRVTH